MGNNQLGTRLFLSVSGVATAAHAAPVGDARRADAFERQQLRDGQWMFAA
jgi:hypothetical protein